MEKHRTFRVISIDVDVVSSVGRDSGHIEWNRSRPGTRGDSSSELRVLVEYKGAKHVALEVDVVKVDWRDPDSAQHEVLNAVGANRVGVSVGLGRIHDEGLHGFLLGNHNRVVGDSLLDGLLDESLNKLGRDHYNYNSI